MLYQIKLDAKQNMATVRLTGSFERVQLIHLSSNREIEGAGPKGIRFTLKNETVTNDCFSFQRPGELNFDRLELVGMFSREEDETRFNELEIRPEGFELKDGLEISIMTIIEFRPS